MYALCRSIFNSDFTRRARLLIRAAAAAAHGVKQAHAVALLFFQAKWVSCKNRKNNHAARGFEACIDVDLILLTFQQVELHL